MFRLCPNCRAKLRPIRYKMYGILRHYFECKCGWTNRPHDLEPKKAVTEADATAAQSVDVSNPATSEE